MLKTTVDGHRVDLPQLLRPFISTDTLVLLNKSDLLSALPVGLDTVIGERAWIASLSTGEGMPEFMAGFAKALQQRYV